MAQRHVPSMNNCDQDKHLLHSFSMSTRERPTSPDEVNCQGLSPSFLLIDKRLKRMQELLEKVVLDREELQNCMTHQQDIIQDWRQLALMLDRIFFFVYLLAITISLFLLFPRM